VTFSRKTTKKKREKGKRERKEKGKNEVFMSVPSPLRQAEKKKIFP